MACKFLFIKKIKKKHIYITIIALYKNKKNKATYYVTRLSSTPPSHKT